MNRFELTKFKGNLWQEYIWSYPCPQKILMVTDREPGFGLDFGSGGFGLSEFVDLIRSGGHTVETAHRNGAGPNLTITGNYKFDTAAKPLILANYDQLWLFGFNTTPLSSAEQTAIAKFMQAGGGVFATGDHGAIGAGLGANLPRIRQMRNWSSIPMSTPTRLDTVLESGPDGIKQFEDQSDEFPQRIFPVFFSNGGDPYVASTWSVHPVLRDSSGAVDYLPDHPHESECLAPAPSAGNFAGVVEWPGSAKAEIVAVSVSAGRFVSSGAPTTSGTKPPVYPRCFNAISAYDGDASSVGRIVCDATWHHFVNINLNGSGSGRNGLYVSGSPTPEYKKIQTYFLNTVRWLAPKNRRRCRIFIDAAITRFDFELAEFQLPRPHPCPWDPLIDLGALAEQSITRNWGPGAAADLVSGLLDLAGGSSALASLLRAQQGTAAQSGERSAVLLPLADLRRAVLGSVINLLAEKLPADEAKLKKFLKTKTEESVESLLSEGVKRAEAAIGEYLQSALSRTNKLIQNIRVSK